MEIVLFNRLGTNSKRAMLRINKQWGHSYTYEPRVTLLKRLSAETGMTLTQVRNQLIKERLFLIKHKKYF